MLPMRPMPPMRHAARPAAFLPLAALLLCGGTAAISTAANAEHATDELGSAIFIHPDGDLEWDRLPHIALYRGHMGDSLTATSNGGATTHAFGVKVASDAYGRTAAAPRGRPIVDDEGRSRSIAMQALRAGLPVGVVQTGISTEPGTGCFLAPADRRQDHDAIAAGLLASGAPVILGGGERSFRPAGAEGVHGPGARADDRDLVAEARAAGYTVIFTRAELLALPADTERVLGLFAAGHTFNARSEETLRAEGTPTWVPGAPTVAEMTDVALGILGRGGRRFLLVVEEEATDNFGNVNHATGVMEAMARADAAIGVARRFVAARPDTLLITCADSDAGGMRLQGIPMPPGAEVPGTLPPRDANGAPIDGVDGTGTAPFIAAPDAAGRRLPFAVLWAARDDVTGGVLVRAEGRLAERVRGSMDNTGIAALIRTVLFGDQD